MKNAAKKPTIAIDDKQEVTSKADPFDPAQFRVSNVLSPGGDGIRR